MGTKITRGQTIDLVVSRGEPERKVEEPQRTTTQTVRVPNVENASLSVAEDGIANRGLYVGSVTTQESSQAEGTVITQYPAPDAEVEVGSTVDLVISRRPEPEPEPIREPEPEPEPARESEPQSNDFPDIPIQDDVPSREDDQSKGRCDKIL